MNYFVSFNNQDYGVIKKRCGYPNEPFQDETFPSNMSSLSPSGQFTNTNGIEWKRPNEICENPCLFIDGCSTHDVCQGELGNCWFISSMAVLALHPKCLNKVIPSFSDQETQLKKSNIYAGIFQFQFWRFGEWVKVVIDDKLPTRNGKLIFAHSKEKNEFWSALLEKAYAKICGSYECMIGGQEEEGLVDFTGGIPEQIFELMKFSMNQKDMDCLFKLIELDWKDSSLMCASISSKHGEMEEKLANGLITTHAYSITGVFKISDEAITKFSDLKIPIHIIRLRNPWGQKEWVGDFCDTSDNWSNVTPEMKMKIGLKVENDGEFCMDFKDFVKNFSQITIVRLIETGILKFNSKWWGSTFRGYWNNACFDRESAIKCDDGGGQYRIDITKPTGDVVLIHLLQKCVRTTDRYLAVLILKVEHNRRTVLHSPKWASVILEYRLGGSRAICLRYRLACGTYIIRPYPTQALKDNTALFYLLRCFTTQENHGLNLPLELTNKTSCCQSEPNKLITRLQILQADLCSTDKLPNALKTYCEVRCENQVFKTNVCENMKYFSWNDAFLLYRSAPDTPIVIIIIEIGRVKNTTLGCVAYPYNESHLNSADVISSADQVFETDFKTPSKIFKCLKVNWFHTTNVSNL